MLLKHSHKTLVQAGTKILPDTITVFLGIAFSHLDYLPAVTDIEVDLLLKPLFIERGPVKPCGSGSMFNNHQLLFIVAYNIK